MPAVSLPGVFNLQEFTSAGDLADGYRLYTYAPATTTHKVTYTDPSGTTPQTYVSDGIGGLYIALDARGELPAPLFLQAGGYDIALKTAAGAAVWTRRAIGQAETLVSISNRTSATEGANLVGLAYDLAYTYGVGKAMRDRAWSITDYPWSAVGDDATDNYTAILAAQTALAAAGGGTLIIPRGTFRILTAIPRVANVDYEGLGWSSILKPVGCGAFVYSYFSGFGRSATRNMWIQASSGTTQTGISVPGTLNDADELYGLFIEGCAITGFNSAISLNACRNFTIQLNWIQDVNSGIILNGKCIVGRIMTNDIIKAAGSGTGTQYGIRTVNFNYTSGAGVISPEGIRINTNQVQGFEYANDINDGIEIRIIDPDYQASINGIRVSSVVSMSIEGGYVQVNGATATFGIHFLAQGVSNNTKYAVKGIKMIAVSPSATSAGIMLGTRTVTGNVDGVTIEDCEFSGWGLNDIEVFSSGNVIIDGNRCFSTGTTNSIAVSAIPSTGRPVYIYGNDCSKVIQYEQASFDSGALQLGTNVISGSTLNYGRAAATTPTFAAGSFTANGAMTWTVAAGDVATYTYEFHGKSMTVRFAIITSTVGGTLNTSLQIAIPGGLTATKDAANPILLLNNSARSIGYCAVSAGGSVISCLLSNAGNWSAATDTTQVQGEITFEV